MYTIHCTHGQKTGLVRHFPATWNCGHSILHNPIVGLWLSQRRAKVHDMDSSRLNLSQSTSSLQRNLDTSLTHRFCSLNMQFMQSMQIMQFMQSECKSRPLNRFDCGNGEATSLHEKQLSDMRVTDPCLAAKELLSRY